MSRRWRFTLVAMVIAGLGAAPILSSATASAAPVPGKVAAAEPAAPGTGLASFWSPNRKETHVFYVGADGQISTWYGDGTTWANEALGTGQPAAVGTGLTADYSPTGSRPTSFTSEPTASRTAGRWTARNGSTSRSAPASPPR